MSSDTIPDEWVEAAARAIYDHEYPDGHNWMTLKTGDPNERKWCMGLARAAIEAVAPLIERDARRGAAATIRTAVHQARVAGAADQADKLEAIARLVEGDLGG